MEAAMTQEDTNLILETMNDKFQQMLDCFSLHSKEIEDLRTELKEDSALVDAKVMGLAERVSSVEPNLNQKIDTVEVNLNQKIDTVEVNLNQKIDTVEKRLSAEITEVRDDLRAHRENVELHEAPKKRILKKVA
jgi:FtsZ-binding cell division protein ZapB